MNLKNGEAIGLRRLIFGLSEEFVLLIIDTSQTHVSSRWYWYQHQDRSLASGAGNNKNILRDGVIQFICQPICISVHQLDAQSSV